MAFIPPPPPGLPPGARPGAPLVPTALPSAAAAAGAAAAALLQRQLAQDGAAAGRDKSEGGWTEHQTGDGRKFYFHEENQISTWEKPDVLMTPEERANDTKWREYKIWDGRVFYHNRETKVSCWSMPPEIRKARGEGSGIDDRPLLQTGAEKRKAFWDLMQEKGVDEDWTWRAVSEATAAEPQAEALDERTRKQCFAELLSLSLRLKQIKAREKERNAAGALERLIEERFSRPEDLDTTYEEAARQLGNEEAWTCIRSDVRRDEVFQSVMERLEEKHRKARADKRTERVVRLQRLMASDPELKRVRLRWKDAKAILVKRDELQEEEPPLEALRVWASLRDLRHVSEHEAEAKAKLQPDHDAYREDRKRRDDFVTCLKEMAARGLLTPETSRAEFEGSMESEPRRTALRDGPGATAMELFDEFVEDVRQRGAEAYADVATRGAEAAEAAEPPAKRPRNSGWGPPEGKADGGIVEASTAEEDGPTALDAIIGVVPGPRAGQESGALGEACAKDKDGAASSSSSSSADEEGGGGGDPLMDAAAKVAQDRTRSTESGAVDASAPQGDADVEMATPSTTTAAVKATEVQATVSSHSGAAPVGGSVSDTPGSESVVEVPVPSAAEVQPRGQETPAGMTGPELPASTAEGAVASGKAALGADSESAAPVQLESGADKAARAVNAGGASAEPPGRLSSAELLAKRVDDLRAMCRERGLPVSGRKQELVDRLATA